MIYVKCPICKKGSPFEVCCNYDKQTRERIFTILDLIKKLFKIK